MAPRRILGMRVGDPLHDFQRQAQVSFGATRARIIGDRRQAVAGSLRQAHVARNGRLTHQITKKTAQLFATDWARFVRSSNIVSTTPSTARPGSIRPECDQGIQTARSRPPGRSIRPASDISTVSAATRAFNVRRSKAGGQSSTMYSNRSSKRLQGMPQTILAMVQRNQLDIALQAGSCELVRRSDSPPSVG